MSQLADKIMSAGGYGLFNWMPDSLYLSLIYRLKMGKKLNLRNPKSFNEKIQWLKIHDRSPLYTTMVDKYEVKKYVASIIGEKYIIPTLGVWDKFDDIDFNNLPDQFVLKCTHDSGGLVICRDKSLLDKNAAKIKIERSMKHNFFWMGREWPYKNVKPRIIAEKYMEDTSTKELRDYKFFCFGGVAKCMKIDFNRFIEHHANYYDENGNILKFGEIICPPVYDADVSIPKTFYKRKTFAETLSAEKPFLRADFYDINGDIYFGELTFYPATGLGKFEPEEFDLRLGEWLKIPQNSGGYILYLGDCIIQFIPMKKDPQSQNDNLVQGLTDYKFYCFNGKPQYLYISRGLENHRTACISFLKLDWNFAEFGRSDYRSFDKLPARPKNYEEMLQLCSVLAKKAGPFIRVDLYEINDIVYFSELTFSPCSGMMPFQPNEWDDKLGSYLDLEVEAKQ